MLAEVGLQRDDGAWWPAMHAALRADRRHIESAHALVSHMLGYLPKAHRGTRRRLIAWLAANDAPSLYPLHPSFDPAGPGRVFAGRDRPLTTAALGGDLVVAGDSDGRVIAWHLGSGRDAFVLSAHARPVDAIAVSPDRHWLVSVAAPDQLAVFALDDRDEIDDIGAIGRLGGARAAGRIALGGARPTALAMAETTTARDADCVVGDAAGCLSRHALPSGQRIGRPLRLGRSISALAPLGAPGLIAVATLPGRIEIWNLIEGRRLAGFRAHDGLIAALAPADDGTRLASIGIDKVIRVWALHPGRAQPPIPVAAFGDGTAGETDSTCLAWLGRDRLISGDAAGGVRVWPLANPSVPHTIPAHIAPVAALLHDRRSNRTISAGRDGLVRLMRPGRRAGQPHRRFGPISDLAGPTAAGKVISCNHKRGMRLWDPDTGGVRRHFAQSRLAFVQTALSGDRRHAWAVNKGGQVFLIDIDEETHAHAATLAEPSPSALAVTPLGDVALVGWHRGRLLTVLIDDAPAKRLSGGADRSRFHCTETQIAGGITAIATTGDGRFAVIAGISGAITMWDIANRRSVRRWPAHQGEIHGLSLFDRDRHVLSVGDDRRLVLSDLAAGERLAAAIGHDDSAQDVSVVAAERAAVTVSHDNSMRLWHLDGLRPAARLHIDHNLNCCLAYRPDRVAAGDDAGHVHFVAVDP